MFPLYDDKNKKIIFWSYKSGCSFIRNIYYNYYLKKNYKQNFIKIITLFSRYNKLDNNKLLTYKKIYVSRNPYSRIISCFIDKYIEGHFTFYLKTNIYISNLFSFYSGERRKFCFQDFVKYIYEKIVLNKFNLLEYDHIAPQFSINYNDDIIFDKIYKLEDLDQSSFLKDEFEIDDKVDTEFKHHSNGCQSKINIESAYLLGYDELLLLKKEKKIPNYNSFYNKEIKNMVYEIYKKDFIILNSNNINYE
jgi:hypothetical protein